MKKLLLALALLLTGGTIVVRGMAGGWLGTHEAPGEITQRRVPAKIIADREDTQTAAAEGVGAGTDKQILFGDLHVHTTFSPDAFFASLPILQGEGAHPPADACDYARYCSALDFWSINDHAEGITPQHWAETVESIRQCNEVSGDAENPDVVAFLGWEWTQVGQTPDTHYGHKNVILHGIEDDEIPARPIGSRGLAQQAMTQGLPTLAAAAIGIGGGDRRYNDLLYYLNERAEADVCPDGVPERELPVDCMESAQTPGVLFDKLDDWGVDSIVIPHGTTWGFYTPAGSTWKKQLTAEEHDPKRQTLVEIYSGHGNSEEYRDFRAVRYDEDGNPYCPEPSRDYLPSCWRAGEIIRDRCAKEGHDADECDQRAAQARAHYLGGGNSGHHAIPGVTANDWLDAGQCQDCFLPSFNYRPGGSVQYMMALRNFDEPEGPGRFRFGFMASSDNHTARPGTGYKEIDRRENTEAAGVMDESGNAMLRAPASEPVAKSQSAAGLVDTMQAFQLMEMERQSSFFLTGGLVATHASGRDRDAIWNAFDRREVYGTSGDRILLWFDLLDDGGHAIVPMGGELEMFQTPRFRVRAVGAFKQKPGCPADAGEALDTARLHHLCRGECYNPSDDRKRITRIEVIRIRPQAHKDEPLADLIEDPWRVFTCEPDPTGCFVEFDDPQFASSGRNALYYVRAIQEPSPAVNADSLRCERDADGSCLDVAPCYGDFRTDYEDDCLAESEERAWSSPIFIDHLRARPGA
ncbi:MAG: DUF3604 domain-containing protein [Candidatus Binatia bacterium]|nr:DUF3604 domain-containing protein [Candidatus Binatia bacterium]